MLPASFNILEYSMQAASFIFMADSMQAASFIIYHFSFII